MIDVSMVPAFVLSGSIWTVIGFLCGAILGSVFIYVVTR